MAISDLKYTKYASILIFKYEPILSDLNTDHKHQLNIGMAQGSEQRVPSTHAIVEILFLCCPLPHIVCLQYCAEEKCSREYYFVLSSFHKMFSS